MLSLIRIPILNITPNLSEQEAIETASNIWDNINGLNLKQNILPTRERANLILRKGENHEVELVKLRK